MKTELHYRTFEELVNSATTDIPHLSLEGALDPQQLLKVVLKINYLLGLKINPVRTKLLELRRGKVKLPADFSVANYAVYCDQRTLISTHTDQALRNPHPRRQFVTQQDPTALVGSSSENILREYLQTLTLLPGPNVLTHGLETEHVLVQATTADGEPVDVRVAFPDANTLLITSKATQPLPLVTVRVLAAPTEAPESAFFTELTVLPGATTISHTLRSNQFLAQILSADGDLVRYDVDTRGIGELVIQSEVTNSLVNARLLLLSTTITTLLPAQPCPQLCEQDAPETTCELLVRYQRTYGEREEFRRVTRLRFARSKGISSECYQLGRPHHPEVRLQDGFLLAPMQEGHIMLCYASVLEDEQGQLLTLDHPKVNDFYEYALKERVYENLYLAGEDVLQKLGYLQEKKLRPAKYEALSFINTPDFADFRTAWELQRKAQLHKYYSLFQ